MGASTTQLDEHGYGLCCTCRKKFFVGDLYVCAYCDKFVCKTHKKNYRYVEVCPSCYMAIKKSK